MYPTINRGTKISISAFVLAAALAFAISLSFGHLEWSNAVDENTRIAVLGQNGLDGQDGVDGTGTQALEVSGQYNRSMASEGEAGVDGTDAGNIRSGADGADGADGTDAGNIRSGADGADGADGGDGIPTVIEEIH